MASTTRLPLSAEQETEAQALAQRIRELTDEEVVQMARLLVSKPDREIFGDTEFELRDIVLKLGAKALQERLRQKKRLSRMQCRLSALPTNRGVSWLSPEKAAEPVGRSDAPTRLLLLPTLRHRLVSVGPRRGSDGPTTDPRRGTGGEFGGLVDR